MLFKYDNGLIGTKNFTNFTISGSDSYESYQKNLKLMDDDWYYRHNPVTYCRNTTGHRSVELSELDSDFILFTGCSITVGSSVELEKTYPYLVSKELNMPYYNLAVEGSGADLLAYNLTTFLKHKTPKYIVVQWPELCRTYKETVDTIIVQGPWTNDSEYQRLLVSGYVEHYSNVLKNVIRNTIPIIEVETVTIDYGRDLKHPGINSHYQMSVSILSKLNSLGQ